jgi:signal transduction histidine kinase
LGNIDLQHGPAIVDQCHAMDHCQSRPHIGREDCRSAEGSALSVQKLAHELNSLLDGSMRCVRLAEQALSAAGAPPNDGESVDDALLRLRTAQRAMNDMAALLSRALDRKDVSGAGLLGSSRTLGEEVEQVRATLAPMAQDERVVLNVDLAPEAGPLPGGPLGHVLANGLRNAIEACAVDGVAMRQVDASITISRDGSELLILITDTGGGLRPGTVEGASTKMGGHGLGLGVCRDVITELGGRIELRGIPFGRGAILEVGVPIRSLERP